MPANDSPAFFVYGTLKRGECRQAAWPALPLSIEPGYVRGTLYDLGPYPALVAGDDWILGEVWRFASASLDAVRATLDAIEVYGQPDEPDLYLRRPIDVYASPAGARRVVCETYFFADVAALRPDQRMVPSCTTDCGVAYASWRTVPDR